MEGKRTPDCTKKIVKYATEILRLLEAVQLPLEVAIIHCRGHSKGNTPRSRFFPHLAEGSCKSSLARVWRSVIWIQTQVSFPASFSGPVKREAGFSILNPPVPFHTETGKCR